MKKLLLLMVGMVLISSIWAQSGKGQGRSRGKGNSATRGLSQLNLSADQQSKVDKMQADYRTEMQKIRNDAALSAEEKKSKQAALAKSHRSNIEGVLTADQKQQWNQMSPSGSKGNRGSNGNRGNSGNRKGNSDAQFEKMKETLKLNPEQATAVQANRTKMQTDMQAIRANDQLSKEERNAAMSKLRQQEQENMKKILSADQFTQWSQMRQKGQRGSKGGGKGRGPRQG